MLPTGLVRLGAALEARGRANLKGPSALPTWRALYRGNGVTEGGFVRYQQFSR